MFKQTGHSRVPKSQYMNPISIRRVSIQMRTLKSSVLSTTVAAAIAIFGFSASPASAESVSSSAHYTPAGSFLKSKPRQVAVHLEGKVSPDAGQSKLRELVNIRLRLPDDVSFWPDGTEPCTKDIGQFDENNANRPTAAVRADCPNSIVGDGTAVINIAGLVAAAVSDPVLTIFNAGKDGQGNPKLLIHGYSATVVPGGHGIIMIGALVNGVLDVKVPRLAGDSAVSSFKFDLPGQDGLDPNYTRAKCSTGEFKSVAAFSLGNLDPNTGGYINKSTLTAAPTFQKCVGKVLKPARKLARPKVYGRHKHHAKQGRSRIYYVKVKSYGRKVTKRVKIKVRGKRAFGKRRVGGLRPGHAKKVKVRVKFRKRGRIKIKFTVNGRGAKAKAKWLKVKVR
ncbi:MAG: hypothetical protein IPK93_11615 [Solirubrobacterales bacterium]|nr:hypothetical protein [Solirubrobacterales bacterium]